METFADRVIRFNAELSFEGELPGSTEILNPFRDNNEEVSRVSAEFYRKFYGDSKQRRMILGINPGRFGAGVTGIPFTDPKRMKEVCGIEMRSVSTHEPSSVFVYAMIERYGGVDRFYSDFYINSICPLGFTAINGKGNRVNYNYYDSEQLYRTVYDFMVASLRKQISFGINRDVCFVLGKKNAKYIRRINEREQLFGELVALEHPRYVVQYRSKYMETYVDKYINSFSRL